MAKPTLSAEISSVLAGNGLCRDVTRPSNGATKTSIMINARSPDLLFRPCFAIAALTAVRGSKILSAFKCLAEFQVATALHGILRQLQLKNCWQ
jgi:hypothetical protein